MDDSIETIWIEVCGKNKNSGFLVGAFYQPSSNEKEKQCCLEKFDYLIAEVYVKWNGMIIIAGDFNINLNRDPGESTRQYKQIVHSFSLKQHINKPTRKNKTLMDHICSNIPTKVVHSDVLHTVEISDHDMPYTILNIKKERYEQRYKYIRSQKDIDINSYVSDFQQLPLNLVYAFDETDDQVTILNKLILDCIEKHAPIKRVRLTRPVAPWIKDESIANLKRQLEHHLHKASVSKQENDRKNYQVTQNKLKKTIKTTKATFLRKAMSSKNPKEVWSTVNRILTKQQTRIKQHPSDLDNHFTTLASKLTDKENAPSNQPDISSMQENSNGFKIQHTNYDQIKKIILGLKYDCSGGYDNIPVRFIKPVSDHLISPLLHIINNSIDKKFFPNSWKIARVCPIPRVDQPTSVKDFRPISVLPILLKVYERVILKKLSNFIEK